MAGNSKNEFDILLTNLDLDGETYKYYDLTKLNDPRYGKSAIPVDKRNHLMRLRSQSAPSKDR